MPLTNAPAVGARGAIALAGLLLAACTAAPPPAAPQPPAAEPVGLPAACVLDIAALSASTGLGWAVDDATAGDRRCVYDPQPAGTAFIAVDVSGPAELDAVAQVCAPGPVTSVGVDGFVCRLPGGGVYAARLRADVLLTVAAAEVPPGSTADRLATAFVDQLS